MEVAGSLVVNTLAGNKAVMINALLAALIEAGGSASGMGALVHLKDGTGDLRIKFNAVDGTLLIYPDGKGAAPAEGAASARLLGSKGDLLLGGGGTYGFLGLYTPTGLSRIRLFAQQARFYLGGNGADGDLMVFPAGGDNANPDGATIWLQGSSGDISLRNGDCAEEFDVPPVVGVTPGAVMIAESESGLRPCSEPYDKRVAGVLAGAGDTRPGIILGRRSSAEAGDRQPIALVGRVNCLVDTGYGAVTVGDLLVTSPTLGHAMKAADPTGAFGAVVGKALRAKSEGRGLLPVLVALL